MIKIISWNVNSIRSRMAILEQLISEQTPDVLLLQETKCLDEKFPHLELDSFGYNIACHGQKSYNGVAIMTKGPIEDVTKGLPNFDDEQARYLECVTTINNAAIRVASVYVPNGSEVGSDKFHYKLAFLEALKQHLANNLKYQEIGLFCGDYNVAPEEIDVYDPNYLEGSIGFNMLERKAIRSIINSGYYDLFRHKHHNLQQFSWWDYRASSLQNDRGMRIDYALGTPEATAKLHDLQILKQYRDLNKTSDHAPILCELNL